jgi:hypothetical protein
MAIGVAIGVGLVLLVIAWLVFSSVSARRVKTAPERPSPAEPGIETLRYRVPQGQDPAVIMSKLDRGGYTATLDETGGDKYLAIACPDGQANDRPAIRSIIDSAHTTAIDSGADFDPGRASFEDEK